MRLTFLDHAPLRLQIGGDVVIDLHPDDGPLAPVAVGGPSSGHTRPTRGTAVARVSRPSGARRVAAIRDVPSSMLRPAAEAFMAYDGARTDARRDAHAPGRSPTR